MVKERIKAKFGLGGKKADMVMLEIKKSNFDSSDEI